MYNGQFISKCLSFYSGISIRLSTYLKGKQLQYVCVFKKSWELLPWLKPGEIYMQNIYLKKKLDIFATIKIVANCYDSKKIEQITHGMAVAKCTRKLWLVKCDHGR